ncbi:putative C-14 sterol reductase [Stachybotrys elegans]|uniref:Delta(14)-sterol reductase n=1 Tax=Stachybotrys elegans TaxID=80388 RepID=A0A8K0SM26_9HYPO|nr:putative C-14 sterol reductase [Stachybotrys elegans]
MPQKHKYEFGGPLGAAAIVTLFPLLYYVFYFACNDISGCPAPILLTPSQLTWDTLKSQMPWPENGIWGFASWEATGWLVAYYMLSLVLGFALPAQEVDGTKLRESGKALKYRLNAFSSTMVQLAMCAVGTYFQGADFVVWTFIYDNYLQLLTGSLILSWIISIYVYIGSFSVKPGNKELRELAVGGQTGNLIYDFYIGRELNPRVTLPIFGEIDIKSWLGMRPGLTGWILLNLTFVAKQYRNYGLISNSMVLTTAAQMYYVLEGQYFEDGLLRMMDVTTDGLGFMLTFGDILLVPFLYSWQCHYLAVYPVHLRTAELLFLAGVFATGLYIFRASNAQKLQFRTDPSHPSVSKLSYIQTKRGTKLLTGGWWGMSRHMNYLGDWMQALPFSAPTALAGYLILPATFAGSDPDAVEMSDGRIVIQGAAKGWGMIFTYCYVVWFATLLIHREGRDDAACAEKYGDDWIKYKKIVRWRIMPGIY